MDYLLILLLALAPVMPQDVPDPEVAEVPVAVSTGTVALITAYNTVAWQTDDTPCIAAGGYVCGRTDVVACPKHIPLGTLVEIEGMGEYVCMDRTASKFNGRFDISFDKDIDGALQFGKRYLEVKILK